MGSEMCIRDRVCIPLSSTPLLVWLTPGRANLDSNSSSSASRHSEITRGILTQSRLSSCCRISSRSASSRSKQQKLLVQSWVQPLVGSPPTAALPSALLDSDRPLFLMNSAIISLMACIIDACFSPIIS